MGGVKNNVTVDMIGPTTSAYAFKIKARSTTADRPNELLALGTLASVELDKLQMQSRLIMPTKADYNRHFITQPLPFLISYSMWFYALIFYGGDKLFPALMPQPPSILLQLKPLQCLCCGPATGIFWLQPG